MKNINPEENNVPTRSFTSTVIMFIIFFFISEFFIVRPLRRKIENKQKQAESEFAQKANEMENNNEIINRDKSQDIVIENENIKLTINTIGLKLDNLMLKKYTDSDGNNIKLLDNKNPITITWLSHTDNLKIPDKNSIWNLVKNETDKESGKAIFSYDNEEGVIFKIIIDLDDKYMVNIGQVVENNTNNKIYIKPLWQMEKILNITKSEMTSFNGGIGVFNGGVTEIKTKKIRNNNLEFQKFDWAGITSKYWLTAIVNEEKENGKVNFLETNNVIKLQYITKDDLVISGNSFAGTKNKLFVGVKDSEMLKWYTENENIKLLDRSIDFGIFYFFAKPMDIILNFFNKITRNFGLAIILLTILIKTILYPIVKKSFVTMEIMKEVQPKMNRIQTKYKDDRIKMQQELVKLYNQYQLNPLASILPIFIQIPVFISLYKVISVSLNMRQAPFFGFIRDLSIADPSNILNLFGILHYNIKFKLGLLPCLMGLSMFLQQKLSENMQNSTTESGKKQDGMATANKSAMTFMPILFTIMFASFPSGLLLYWIFNNLITILQQWYVVNIYLKKYKLKRDK